MNRIDEGVHTLQLTPAQHAFVAGAVEGFRTESWDAESAGAAGSDRRFIRLREKDTDRSFVLIAWDSSDHDWSRFLAIQQDVKPVLSVLPEIYAYDRTHGLILEEDLGDQTLHRAVSGGEDLVSTYVPVLQSLAQWQALPARCTHTIRARMMDQEMFLWESDYFATHCVTEFFGCERALNASWERMRSDIADIAASCDPACIHRDFQSENILVHKGAVRFVDYQGARLGPPEYDLASLLYDPYIDQLSDSVRTHLITSYRGIPGAVFDERRFVMNSAQRLMQAMGAYANLSMHKGKQRYREYIGPAMLRLHTVTGFDPLLRKLREIVTECLTRMEHIPLG